MEVRTYTDFWAMEKKLYSIYDLSLPAPVPIRALLIAIGTGVPWCALLWFIGVPLSPWGLILYASLPLGLAFGGTKQIFEKKNLFQFFGSLGRFVFESRHYNGLQPTVEDKDVVYEYEIKTWQRSKPIITKTNV